MIESKNIRNVLVVEDDKDTVEIISRALSREGFRVTMSLNMEDALVDFARLKYELVVTDIFMRGMGGIEGIQKMRELRPAVRILATSAGYSEMTPEAALKAAGRIGADAILAKPFSLEDLRAEVKRLFGDGD
jgi:DNA-binding response OmpR family regulator